MLTCDKVQKLKPKCKNIDRIKIKIVDTIIVTDSRIQGRKKKKKLLARFFEE